MNNSVSHFTLPLSLTVSDFFVVHSVRFEDIVEHLSTLAFHEYFMAWKLTMQVLFDVVHVTLNVHTLDVCDTFHVIVGLFVAQL